MEGPGDERLLTAAADDDTHDTAHITRTMSGGAAGTHMACARAISAGVSARSASGFPSRSCRAPPNDMPAEGVLGAEPSSVKLLAKLARDPRDSRLSDLKTLAAAAPAALASSRKGQSSAASCSFSRAVTSGLVATGAGSVSDKVARSGAGLLMGWLEAPAPLRASGPVRGMTTVPMRACGREVGT